MSKTLVISAVTLATLLFWLLGAHTRLARLRQRHQSAQAPLSHALRQRQVVALTLAETARSQPDVPEDRIDQVLHAAHQATAASHHPHVRTQSDSFQRMVDAEEQLGRALDSLVHTLHDLSYGEALPPAISELMRQRHTLQGQIIFAAQVYNDAACEYNDALQIFPTTVAARLLHFQPTPAFLLTTTQPPVLIGQEPRPARLLASGPAAPPGDLI